MRFKANDGSYHGSQRAAFEHGQKPVASKPDDGAVEDHGGIKDDPEAMQAIDLLKSKGYSPEDVADCMRDESYDDDQSRGAEATKAAPLQIPGM
jgi:hypothetical protein